MMNFFVVFLFWPWWHGDGFVKAFFFYLFLVLASEYYMKIVIFNHFRDLFSYSCSSILTWWSFLIWELGLDKNVIFYLFLIFVASPWNLWPFDIENWFYMCSPNVAIWKLPPFIYLRPLCVWSLLLWLIKAPPFCVLG